MASLSLASRRYPSCWASVSAAVVPGSIAAFACWSSCLSALFSAARYSTSPPGDTVPATPGTTPVFVVGATTLAFANSSSIFTRSRAASVFSLSSLASSNLILSTLTSSAWALCTAVGKCVELATPSCTCDIGGVTRSSDIFATLAPCTARTSSRAYKMRRLLVTYVLSSRSLT